LYLVAAALRDALLAGWARPRFTTDARPQEIQRICPAGRRGVDIGIAFGTVGARKQGVTCEVTTFRADTYDRVSRTGGPFGTRSWTTWCAATSP